MDNNEVKQTTSTRPPRQLPAWLLGFLRWVLMILIAFALGAALITIGMYLPLQQKYNLTKADLSIQSTALANRQAALETQTSINASLEQALADTQLRAAILNALSAVRTARLAIASGNEPNATLLVGDVIQALDDLAPLVTTDKDLSEVVASLEEKATQAQSILLGDPAAADATLEQLDATLDTLLENTP